LAQNIAAVFGLLLGFNMLFFMVPKVLQDLCINTHIEMMKDHDIIKDVIRDQKLDKAERGLRILASFR
jgi:hypothetical protein